MLTKPGIIRGNLLTAIGGFFLAADGMINLGRFVALLVGMTLVIGSACVFNNYLDRNIDRQMVRTKGRITAGDQLNTAAVLIYGTVLVIAGSLLLLVCTNVLTTLLGLFGFLTYVGVYTPAKHRTPYATLLGTIPGAVPPVAGYTAITGRLDTACALLFAILVCWQMPHFYAIAIRRLDEYKAAKVPVWPAMYGVRRTKRQMVWFMAAFIALSVRLSLSGYASTWFAVVLGLYGAYWLFVALKGIRNTDETKWAKTVFLLSLPVLPLFSLLLALDHWLS